MQLRVVTPPAGEPLELAFVKTQLKVKHASEDALLTSLIMTARQHLEGVDGKTGTLGRALLNQQLELTIDGFPRCGLIDLQRGPVSAVDGIEYLDGNGDWQDLDAAIYTADLHSLVARVRRRYGKEWPQTLPEPQSVRITYTAGYGADAADVPMPIRQAMLLLIGGWYALRSPNSTGPTAESLAVDALLLPYRLQRAP